MNKLISILRDWIGVPLFLLGAGLLAAGLIIMTQSAADELSRLGVEDEGRAQQ